MKIFLLITLLVSVLRAEDPGLKGPGLDIALISGNTTMTPGHPFTVGLHIKHFPGFHTYWKNPGMVGMETSIEWVLPDGFTASEIQWPFPENTFMGEYPCHGYERDVTLLVIITPPKEITAKKVTLTAKTSWMCCARGCFPGFDTFTLEMPVTDAPVSSPKHRTIIARSATELPATDHAIKATLISKVDAPLIEINFTSPTPFLKTGLYFFSNDRQISSDQKQVFLPQEDGSVLLKIARSEFSPEQKTTIPGVLKIGAKSFALEARAKN